MQKNSEWIDQLVDLIIDCFLWEWKSGRLAKGKQESYTQNNSENVENHESNNSN